MLQRAGVQRLTVVSTGNTVPVSHLWRRPGLGSALPFATGSGPLLISALRHFG